jgi:hypothetical protein
VAYAEKIQAQAEMLSARKYRRHGTPQSPRTEGLHHKAGDLHSIVANDLAILTAIAKKDVTRKEQGPGPPIPIFASPTI